MKKKEKKTHLRGSALADLDNFLHGTGSVEVHPRVNHLAGYLVHQIGTAGLVHLVRNLLEKVVAERVLPQKKKKNGRSISKVQKEKG